MIGECPGVGVFTFENFPMEIEYPLKNTHRRLLLGMSSVFDGEDFKLFPIFGNSSSGNLITLFLQDFS